MENTPLIVRLSALVKRLREFSSVQDGTECPLNAAEVRDLLAALESKLSHPEQLPLVAVVDELNAECPNDGFCLAIGQYLGSRGWQLRAAGLFSITPEVERLLLPNHDVIPDPDPDDWFNDDDVAIICHLARNPEWRCVAFGCRPNRHMLAEESAIPTWCPLKTENKDKP